MADLILEPYSTVLCLQVLQTGLQPELVLKDALETLAGKCPAAGNSVIGHIKALALFPDHQYLRVSVVAANLPATLEGAAPADCTELEITLNVLVYGLTRSQIDEIVLATLSEIAQRWLVRIS